MEDSPELSPNLKAELDKFQATEDDKRKSVYVSLMYLCITIFIGIPVWWVTTSTYHARLPYSEIDLLNTRPIEVSLPIKLINFHDKLTLTHLDQLIKQSNQPSEAGTVLKVNYRLHLTQTDENQRSDCENIISMANSLDEFCELFEKKFELTLNSRQRFESTVSLKSHSSVYHFILLPLNETHLSSFFWFKRTDETSRLVDQPIFVIRPLLWTNFIYVFIPSAILSSDGSLVNLSTQLETLLNTISVGESDLKRLIQHYNSSTINPQKLSSTSGITRFGVDKIHAKSLPVSAFYDVTLTLLTRTSFLHELDATVDVPSQMWTGHMLSDPTSWLNQFVEPAFHTWLPYVQVNFHSQRLYAIDVEKLQPSRPSTDGGHRYYTQTDLSTLLNQLESYLGAPQFLFSKHVASKKPGIHLVLLFASAQITKGNDNKTNSRISCTTNLRFHAPSSSSSQYKIDVTDFALVPQWGGLFSIDAPAPCTSDPNPNKKLALKLISVVKSLLGIPETEAFIKQSSPDNSLHVIYSGSKSFGKTSNLELDWWFMWRIVEGLYETKRTLNSLINLLARVPNMVINDNVAGEIYEACANWASTLNNLQRLGSTSMSNKSDNSEPISLGEVFLQSYSALNSSNGAFFDPSLLGLLYFEEDQKYGIYAPLFAPICFALLMSTVRAGRILISWM